MLHRAISLRERAAALVIVLAFVVLFTVLVVAYVSRVTSDRPVAHGSFNQTKADELAQSAMDNIIGDLRQEIISVARGGSTATTVNGVTIYTPTSPADVVPQRSGNLASAPNLVRRSIRSDPIPTPAMPSRASAVNSSVPSSNGRYITSTRWNSHYLVPKGAPATADSSPIPAFDSATPDWVFVTNNGATIITSPSNSVIGRYAYAIYDEGALLDANLVGLPSPSPGAVTTPSPSPGPSATYYISRKGTIAFADLTALPLRSGGSTPDPKTISKIVGWRNYVTTTVSVNGTFPNLSPSPSPFVTYFLDSSRDFLTVNPITNSPKNNRTDQRFTTRSDLIHILANIGDTGAVNITNLLQYLGTFSREQNAPTWNSASNPIVQRFQLGNISLLGNTPISPPGSSPSPAPTGTQATNIKTYFGLQWSTTYKRWQYVGQGTTLLPSISPPAASPAPDFFQILNYAIPGHTIAQVLSLGACIIDQYDSDQVTTAIEYGPSPQPIAWGMEDRSPSVLMGLASPSPSPTPSPTPLGYVVLQRPFQNVGELGYAYNPITHTTLNFYTSGSSDAALLDFFTYNLTNNMATYNLPFPLRAGPVNVNTRNTPIIAAILQGALPNEPPTTAGVSSSAATTAASLISAATNTQPAVSRQDIARLANAVGTTIGSTEEQKETVARALTDATQTRTWGLLIDVIAQSGRYGPNETNLANFVVEGEQRYWVHVAIDRFTGRVIDKQIEVVNE